MPSAQSYTNEEGCWLVILGKNEETYNQPKYDAVSFRVLTTLKKIVQIDADCMKVH